MTHPNQITDAADIAAFVTGGRSVFTVVSKRTETRYTYKVSKAKDNDSMFFVSTLTGPDNGADYTYIGFFKADGEGKMRGANYGPGILIAGRKGNSDDVRFRGLDYILSKVVNGIAPDDAEFWHEGRCARCARPLTDPVSIERGLGPECATKV